MENKARNIGIIIVLVAVFGVGYVYYRNQVNLAVTNIDIVFNRVEIRGFRLLPSPEANLTLTYVVNNTRDIEFRITMDGELYYGSHFITPLTVEDSLIRANGLSTVHMDVTITGSILNIIDLENMNEYIIQGELIATSRILGLIPVTVSKSLSDYQPGQS
jgi:hypothetical protein